MKKIPFILTALILSGGAQAQKMSIQDRLTRLEQQAGGTGGSNTADLVYQVQQLQQQIAQMQGTIEEQNHQINQLKDRQKVLYVDVDSRITHIEEAMGGQPKNELTEDSAINDTETASATPVVTAPVVRPTVDAQISTQTVNNANVTSTAEPTDSAAKTQYQTAFNELKAGRFNESARMFEDFIQAHPNDDLTDNAYYWLGESYYVSRNYPLALAAFQNLVHA